MTSGVVLEDSKNLNYRFPLGDLLVQFEFATASDLTDMLTIANQTCMPVGRVFVMSGVLTESDLENLILCQTHLKERTLDIDLAKKAIQMARDSGAALEDVLVKLGWVSLDSLRSSTPLGELLVESEYISQTQLDTALTQHRKSGLPLGRTLVLNGTITETLLKAAVNAQILIRDKKLSRGQAVEELREVVRTHIPLETSLQSKGFYDLPKRSAPRLGELLIFAGLISDSELVSALETGLISKLPVGEVLLQSKLVTKNVLEAALFAQKSLSEGKISFYEVRAILERAKEGHSFEVALGWARQHETEQEKKKIPSLYAFLRMLNCVSDTEILQAFESAKHNTQIISNILLLNGILDESTLKKADECRAMVHEGRLSLEHATIAFDYSRRRSITLAEALTELQWHDSEDLHKAHMVGQDSHSEQINVALLDLNEMRQMALQLMQRGDPSGSRRVWKDILVQLPASQDLRHVECLEGIAETHIVELDFNNARVLFRSALQSRTELSGDDSLSQAFAANNMGRIAYLQQAYSEAEYWAGENMRILSLIKSADHPDVACGHENLASLHMMQKNYVASELSFKNAIRICSQHLGDAHPTTIRISRNYASLLQKMDRTAEAKSIDSRASGTVTGSWKALQLPDDNRLF